MMQDPRSIYDFIVKNDEEADVSLGSFKGKVLLICQCRIEMVECPVFHLLSFYSRLTNSNYAELNQLYEKHRSKGLEILVFPCNQFGDEEPGTNAENKDFVCTRFKLEFPIFDNIEVNGENVDPLYKFLKSGKWGMFKDDIQWNFAKFLVDRDGVIVHRYYPTTSPLTMEGDIKKLLEISRNHQSNLILLACRVVFLTQADIGPRFDENHVLIMQASG